MLVVDLNEATDLPPELLGRKGVGLTRLRQLGLPVPPGFILTTDAFRKWNDANHSLDEGLRAAVGEQLHQLRRKWSVSKEAARPFLLSVRSSPVVSMPGLLSSIVNVGIDPNWVIEQLQSEQSRRFAWEIARDFLVTYSDATNNAPELMDRVHRADKEPLNGGVFATAVHKLLTESLANETVLDQIATCISAVFQSQFGEGAADALAHRAIDIDLPSAVIVQAMVFGNWSTRSASGVIWTRDLQTGKPPLSGTYLSVAQGHEIVGSTSARRPSDLGQMKKEWPADYENLARVSETLDRVFSRVQEVEFTIEQGHLWLLQTRDAALSPLASVQYACDRVDSGDWSPAEAVKNTRPDALSQFADPNTVEELGSSVAVLASGLSGSGGVATGPLVVRTSQPTIDGSQNELTLPPHAIVLAESLTPHDDFDLLRNGAGFATILGGPGTHTASLLRKLGKPYVVNLNCELVISEDGGSVEFGGEVLDKNELVTIDGDRGCIYRGEPQNQRDPATFSLVERFAQWVGNSGSRSSWRVFDYERPASADIQKAVESIVREQRWRSEKAVITDLLSLIPQRWRIEQRVFEAENRAAIRAAMLAGLEAGFWIGSKVCRSTDPRLGNGPWQTGIRSVSEIDAFLEDPAYVGIGGPGGYVEWIRDTAVSELVVVFDPPEKGLQEAEGEHFVCTVSCSASPPQLQMTLMLGTSKLRALESASPGQMIVVTMEPDYQHQVFLGHIRPIIGSEYWSISNRDERGNGPELRGETSFRRLAGLVDERSLSVAVEITSIVLHDLWRPPFDLPHYMLAIDDEFGLDTLEFQGRADSQGHIQFFKVFDAKGHEEQLVANSLSAEGV